MLHAVQLLGGKAVSVTTDGFITDIEDLEKKVIDLYSKRTAYNQKMDRLVKKSTKKHTSQSSQSCEGFFELKNNDYKKSKDVFSLFREYRRARALYAIPIVDGLDDEEDRTSNA